jgi:hypothetical protein
MSMWGYRMISPGSIASWIVAGNLPNFPLPFHFLFMVCRGTDFFQPVERGNFLRYAAAFEAPTQRCYYCPGQSKKYTKV